MGGRGSGSGMSGGGGSPVENLVDKLQKVTINEDWVYLPEPGQEKDMRKNLIPFVGVGKDKELDEKLDYGFSTKIVSVQDDVEVNVSSLKTLQAMVDVNGVKRALNGKAGLGQPVKVVEYRGQLYLMDGNHRAVAAKLRGQKTIRAKVIRRVDK